MLSDVPNFAFAIGYTNSSWTLKVDLVCEYLVQADRAHGPPRLRRSACRSTTTRRCRRGRCWTSAPATCSAPSTSFPRQGTSGPWQMAMSYAQDLQTLRDGAVDDAVLHFSRSRERVGQPA